MALSHANLNVDNAYYWRDEALNLRASIWYTWYTLVFFISHISTMPDLVS